jgi:two-component system OmpR family response regulator
MTPMRLLVVEDDPALRQSLAGTLREEGFAVDEAADGEEGLEAARNAAYDCILLDVMMPRLDGWEVLEALRPRCTSPVLMLTARDAVPDRIRGLNQGADDYLTKPFDPDELVARIRALIRRAAGQVKAMIEVGAVTIDTAARRVLVDGDEVALTAREYSLLEFLALHRGEVVTRTALYDHLFGDDESSLSNLLDVHVSNLRRKLGHDVIVTRRGHGYSIP